MAGERVLIVDDNELNSKLLSVLLTNGGYQVDVAADAREAFAKIAATPPALIFMDIQLPDIDGLEVTRRLKQDPATRDIHILAVTAYAMKGDEEKALAAGCDGYVTKPIDTRSLIDVVRNMIASGPPKANAAAGNGHDEKTAATNGAVTPDDERPLVLVVEDDEQMNRFLVAALSLTYRVASARDGVEGLERAEALQPDLIMTDMMMPRMRGDELVAALRERPHFDNTPILILTGTSDNELRVRLLRSGVSDYLAKPCSREEIDARVGNLISMKRARSVLQGELASQQADLEALAKEITRRNKELQTSLDSTRVAREQAEHASTIKSNFLQMVSHELRTPLTSLMMGMQQLERLPDRSEKETTILKRIERASRRLMNLIESLLEYSRLQADRLTLHVEDLDLAAVCDEIVEEMRPQAEEKSLDLRVFIAPKLPPLRSDFSLVRLVIVNLVVNAIKFTQRGYVELRISAADGQHLVAVVDTGIGIPKKDHERIFEPFLHLEPIEGKHTPGTGLGLALVRQMAAALGGTIAVESMLGMGSTFTVRLPPIASEADAESIPPLH